MAAPIRRGAKLAMPVLVVNLGVEMIYVLEQRLRAQAIPPEKSRLGAFRPVPTAAAARPRTRGPAHPLPPFTRARSAH